MTRIFFTFLLLTAPFSAWTSPQAKAEVVIDEERMSSQYVHQRVSMTPAAVREAMSDPHASITQVSEEEATRAAALRGVSLSKPSESSSSYGHPWFIVKLGIGLPGMIDADIEIYVSDNWTVEAGAGTGLIANVITAGVRWRPDALCWGCQGNNLFSIGLGMDALGADDNSRSVLIAAVADAHYIHRFAEHFGWVIGTKLGMGPAFATHRVSNASEPAPPGGPQPPPNSDPVSGGNPSSGPKTEPGLTFFLYTGFQF